MAKYTDIDVITEEILIHNTAATYPSGRTYVDVRIVGTFEIDGKTYEFNKVIEVLALPKGE
jgi:hypothetical protein